MNGTAREAQIGQGGWLGSKRVPLPKGRAHGEGRKKKEKKAPSKKKELMIVRGGNPRSRTRRTKGP